MITVTRISALTGRASSMELDVTAEQLHRYFFNSERPFVQDVFPHLPPEQREFLKSGITPDEWDAALKDTDQ